MTPLTDRQQRTLECARYYVSQGWAILPLYSIDPGGRCTCGKPDCPSPGKHPFTPFVPNGAINATAHRDTVEKWFSSPHPLNIGVAAGQESGLVLLDVDPGHGGNQSLERYAVPRTLVVFTGGGGTHYYFKHPAAAEVRNSAGTLGPGLDVRGHHGYVAAPPSLHASGKEYRFTVDPRAVPIADCPDWIVNQHKAGESSSANPAAGQPGSEAEIKGGSRNTTLTSYAGTFRKMGMGYSAICAALTGINTSQCKPPLPDKELTTIAASVCGYQAGEAPRKHSTSLVTKKLSEYTVEPVEWLWPNRFPTGEVSLLVGDPGVGKSFLSTLITATVTRGNCWPDNPTRTQQGDVLLISGEDDPARAILPRMLNSGGDPARVTIVQCVKEVHPDGTETNSIVQLSKHMHQIEQALIANPEIRLMILDPLTSYMGKGTDANNNLDVVMLLEELSVIVRKYRVTALGLTHMNKDKEKAAIGRVLGSMGFVGRARSVWCVAKDKDDPERRLFAPIKTNYSIRPTGLAFQIMDPGRVVFEEQELHINADEALAADSAKGQGGARGKRLEKVQETVLEWIVNAYSIERKTILARCKEQRISEATARRAIDALLRQGNIAAVRAGFPRTTVYTLPGVTMHDDLESMTNQIEEERSRET